MEKSLRLAAILTHHWGRQTVSFSGTPGQPSKPTPNWKSIIDFFSLFEKKREDTFFSIFDKKYRMFGSFMSKLASFSCLWQLWQEQKICENSHITSRTFVRPGLITSGTSRLHMKGKIGTVGKENWFLFPLSPSTDRRNPVLFSLPQMFLFCYPLF